MANPPVGIPQRRKDKLFSCFPQTGIQKPTVTDVCSHGNMACHVWDLVLQVYFMRAAVHHDTMDKMKVLCFKTSYFHSTSERTVSHRVQS